MGERVPRFAETEQVTAEQVSQELTRIQRSIEESVLYYSDYNDYRSEDTERILGLLEGKIGLFLEGLLPSDDYSGLYEVIDYQLGLAEALSYKPENILSSEGILRRSLNAVQGNMVVNGVISQEAQKELLRRWPVEPKDSD